MQSYQVSTFAPVTPALLTQQNNPILLDAELSNFQTQLESLIRPYEKQLTPGQNIVMAEVHSNFIYPNQKFIFKNIPLSFPTNETRKEVSFRDRIIFDNCTWHSEGNVSIASGTLTAESSDEENSSKKVKISLTANGPDALVAGIGSSKGTQIILAAATANARAIGLSPNISVIQKHPEAFCKKTVLIDDVEELIEAPTMAYAAWQKTQTGHLTSKVKTMSSPSNAPGARSISLNTAQVTIISPADKSKQFKISRKQEEKSPTKNVTKNKAIVPAAPMSSTPAATPPTSLTSSNTSASSTASTSLNVKQSTNSSNETNKNVSGDSLGKTPSEKKLKKRDLLGEQQRNMTRQGIGTKAFVEYDKIKTHINRTTSIINQATSINEGNKEAIYYALENRYQFNQKTVDKALTLVIEEPHFVSVVEQFNINPADIEFDDIF